VGSGLVPGRGARALECAWSDFCARGPSSMPVVQVFVAGLPVGLLAGLVSPLPLELLPRGGRRAHNGRPWEYVVLRTISPRATREPTARQKLLIRNWNLVNARGRGLLLCNLRRAEEKLRKYFASRHYTHASISELVTSVPIPVELRDKLGMVLYPGEVGATITRACAGSNWVGGESAGPMRFITSVEVAGFMGIGSGRGGPCAVAQRYYNEFQLCGLLAESVHSRVADFAMAVGQHYLSSPVVSCGSLYSGAFDELGSACGRAFPGSHRSFVAESDPDKLRVLWESHGPHHCYSTVESVGALYPADVLVASPPCLIFSKANRTSTLDDRDRTARAQVGQLRRVVELLAPRLVVLEQTDGLRTHSPDAYGLFLAMWAGLPYRAFHSPVDAHECGGTHYRSRLIWVAVRMDSQQDNTMCYTMCYTK
jgi:hypothetical protein